MLLHCLFTCNEKSTIVLISVPFYRKCLFSLCLLLKFSLFFFFFGGPFLKSLLNFFAIHVLIFGQEVCRVLPWMEPVCPALGDEILTTGPQGSPRIFSLSVVLSKLIVMFFGTVSLIFLYLTFPEFFGSLSYNFNQIWKFFNLYFSKYFSVPSPPLSSGIPSTFTDALLFVLCFCYFSLCVSHFE